jgi:hypothetical protein
MYQCRSKLVSLPETARQPSQLGEKLPTKQGFLEHRDRASSNRLCCDVAIGCTGQYDRWKAAVAFIRQLNECDAADAREICFDDQEAAGIAIQYARLDK